MTIKTNLTTIVIAALGGVTLLVGGAASGYALAKRDSADEAVTANLAPCNLHLKWDRVTQEHLAVYEDSTWVSDTGDYGRTANLSCTDDEILAWQQQRRDNGLDVDVCRPVLHAEVTGIVHSIGCAVPILVVSDESR